MTGKIRRKLNDSDCAAMREFFGGEPVTVWDTTQPGLRLIVGRNRSTWSFYRQHSRNGKRSSTVVVLGHVEGGMSVKEARTAAQVLTGRIAAGRAPVGKRAAVKLSEAWTEYAEHLRDKAAERGKPARWAYNAEQLWDAHISEFAKYSLADLAMSPALIKDWHKRTTKKHGPVSANRAAQVLRAIYRNAAKLNRNLPPHLPTSAVVWNTERPAEKGVLDFAAWFKGWKAISSPVRRSFLLTCLLTGGRGGEVSRLEWTDIDVHERSLILRNTKANIDVHLPLSVEIIRALKLARGADPKVCFPGARHNPSRDGIAYGHTLRHAYASIGRILKIDPLLVKILMGHSLGGSDVTEGYLSRGMFRVPLFDAQRRISRAIMSKV